MKMKILLCLLLFLITNKSKGLLKIFSLEETLLRFKEHYEPKDESFQVCSDPQISLNFSNAVLLKVGSDFIASPLVSCLNMNNNNISEVSSSAFDKLPKLTYLNLANNSIEEDKILKNGNHGYLKMLVLDGSFTRSQLTFSGSFPSLEKLYLRNNSLYSVNMMQTNGVNFSKLTHLYLNDNKMSHFSFDNYYSNSASKAFASLNYLYLDNNNLNSVYIPTLHKLLWLSIDNNKLNSLGLQQGVSLQYLSAVNNSLDRIGVYEIRGTANLKVLNLVNNKIWFFDEKILESRKLLVYLNLENNKMDEIPPIMEKSFLKFFSLRCNRIKTLNTASLLLMPHLVVFHLDWNLISEIEADTFSALVNLEILTLGNNNLSSLPPNWSDSLKNLRYLNLEGNKFTNLESMALVDTVQILDLYLQNNPLEYLNSHSFDTLPENITIHLDSKIVAVESCVQRH